MTVASTSSTTTAGISAIAGDTAKRTSDNAQGIGKLFCCVIAAATDRKRAARLADGDGLLLQIFNELVTHLSSRAKRSTVCQRRFKLTDPAPDGTFAI